ncbi:MAG: DUF3179 domain-containing protein [Planctomycetaceae bacterium]|nr:DUF3179 domain-containing protein [Planctomycetaceae bacterium]
MDTTNQLKCNLHWFLVFVLLFPIAVKAQKPENRQSTRTDFRPRRLLKEQPAITQFDTKTAAEAARVLDPAELVLGVVIGDQARAYPINMLTGPHREIINDTINRRPIAATW